MHQEMLKDPKNSHPRNMQRKKKEKLQFCMLDNLFISRKSKKQWWRNLLKSGGAKLAFLVSLLFSDVFSKKVEGKKSTPFSNILRKVSPSPSNSTAFEKLQMIPCSLGAILILRNQYFDHFEPHPPSL